MSVVTVYQARILYIAYLQQRISQTPEAYRNVPSEMAYNPSTGQWASLSLTQLLGEVQRGTPMGVNKSIEYARTIGKQVVQ